MGAVAWARKVPMSFSLSAIGIEWPIIRRSTERAFPSPQLAMASLKPRAEETWYPSRSSNMRRSISGRSSYETNKMCLEDGMASSSDEYYPFVTDDKRQDAPADGQA